MDIATHIQTQATESANLLRFQGWEGGGNRYDIGSYPGDVEALAERIGRETTRDERVSLEYQIRRLLDAAIVDPTEKPIRLTDVRGTRVDVRAERSCDDDGWVVQNGTGEDATRTFYADNGGAWRLAPDGTLSRQTHGTGQVRAPRSRDDFERWLNVHIAVRIDTYATDY